MEVHQLNGELNDFMVSTHSSDNRCSRWKVLGWISLMLFILRSLVKEKGARISINIPIKHNILYFEAGEIANA